MTAHDLFHAGKLREAIEAQISKVKSSPADRAARLFLFELFLFSGDLDRARKQLDVLNYEDPQHSAAIAQFRNGLDAEAKRRAVFAGKELPKSLVTAPDHVKLRLEALPLMAANDFKAAKMKLDEANHLVPAVDGMIDGKPFTSLYDADERFGTVVEIFGVGGIYSWVPLENIVNITMNPPAAPRDVIWRPAHIVLSDGLEGDVLLPGLYPNSYEFGDEEIQLGRATDWVEGDIVRGVGGRMLVTATDHLPMQQIGQILRPSAAEVN